MISITELSEYIGIVTPQIWEDCFQEAMEGYDPLWLQDMDFSEILQYYGFTDTFYYETIQKGLQMLREDAMLHRACWMIHYVLYYAKSANPKNIYGWGNGGDPYREHGSNVINVIALLAGQPIHAENMRIRGYDAEQIAIHKTGIRNAWVGEHEDYGYDGISFRLLGWSVHYVSCELVRLGRLIYQYAPTKYAAYNQQFGDGACIIDIHIPTADNGLQDAEVEASIRLAREKFNRYFPEAAGKQIVFAVSTWLLSPQLKEILKPDSNIIKFQNRFTVTKLYAGTQSFLINVFHITQPVAQIDISALPEDTRLRKEVKARLLRGEEFQNGVGYFLC